MADVWGLMPKSQEDNETIEGAIARMIAEHEEDPEAHLGEGESLEQHKTNEIIDHPAGSVVMDKIPFQQYDENSADLEGHEWSVEEGTAGYLLPRVLSASLFSQTDFIIVGITNHKGHAEYPDLDLFYQFKLSLNGHQSSNGSFSLSFCDTSPFDDDRISIEKDGTNFFFRIYSGGSVVASYNLGVGASWSKYLRLYYDSTSDTIRLYIGTTEVLTYVTADWRDFVFEVINISMSRTTNTNIEFEIRDWKMRSAIDVD